MLENYIEDQYIVLPFALATPALIITVVYILTLSIYIALNKKIKVEFINLSNMNPSKKKDIVLSGLGYVILIFSCINLPAFISDENLILKVATTYLEYEPFLFFVAFLFMISAFFNKVNKDTQLNVSNRILHYLIWCSIAIGLLVGQIEYTLWQNKIVVFIAGLLILISKFIEIKINDLNVIKSDRFDMISYSAIQGEDGLFPRHKEQAEEIVDIILKSSPAPLSICLSGEWGAGKTSVLNGVVDMLKSKFPNNCLPKYEFIYINALELDNKEAILNYLMTQIKEILKMRGAYVGFNSEYKEFISSTIGTITTKELGIFLNNRISCGGNDYRKQKQRLQKVIERCFQDGKLIVVVDDIERCDKTTARDYLFLIKEISTMDNCISIFVTDYEMLEGLIHNEKLLDNSPAFLEKFFDYKIRLRDEPSINIFDYYDKFFKEDDPAFSSIYKVICKSPGTWREEIVSAMNLKLQMIEKDLEKRLLSEDDKNSLMKKKSNLEECLTLFGKLMKNPRYIAKFYNVVRNNVHSCAKQLFSSDGKNSNVERYVDSRNIGQVLFILSFMEVCMPNEYEKILEQGSKYIECPLLGINAVDDVDKRLVMELFQGLVFGEYFEFQKPTDHIKDDIRKFVNTFLGSKKDISQLINTFSTKEEKWISAIDNLDVQIIQENWDSMVCMILQKNSNISSKITNEWRNEKLDILLNFAEQQIKKGYWSSDKIFSLFEPEIRLYRYFSIGTGVLQTFWNHLNSSTVYSKPSIKVYENIKNFSLYYSYERIRSTYLLAHYLIPIDVDLDVQTKKLQECLLNSNRPFFDNLSAFLKGFEKTIPNFSFSSDSWYENFKEFSNYIKVFLDNQELSNYWDIKVEIEHMLDSSEEFWALKQILDWCEKFISLNLKDISEGDIDNLTESILTFENLLKEQCNDREYLIKIEDEFIGFINHLKNERNKTITEEQIKRLHNLITVFINQTGHLSLPYRRILINISNKNDWVKEWMEETIL